MRTCVCKLLILFMAPAAFAADPEAQRWYEEAQKAERAGDTFHAYLLYARASELEPLNVEFMARKDAMATKAADTAAANMASTPPEDAAAKLASGEYSPAEIEEHGPALPPARLKPSSVRKAFNLRGSPQQIIEQVAAAYGIQVVFDTTYQPPPNFLFKTGELGMEEALRTLEEVSNSLIVPVNQNLALVSRDTPQRRAESAPVMAIEIPIPERLSVQDAQEIVTAVQQTMEIRRITVDPTRHSVFLRDSVSKVMAAQALFSQLSRLRGQVEVEVELLSVVRHSGLNIGFNWQNSFPVVTFSDFMNNMPSFGSFTKFLVFGGGKTVFGVGITDAAAFATVAKSLTQNLLTSEIVTVDGVQGQLHVGDHYPIITNGYYGPNTGAGQVYTPPPTVQFVDLGLVLKVTPSLHESGEMTLDIDAEYNVLGQLGANNIPSISQRKYQGKVRIGKDEWAVIAGLTQETRSVAVNGIAGLSRLPLLGRLFRADTYTTDDAEVLIVLKPHVTNLPPWDFPSPPLWVGTESKPLSVY